MPKLEFKEAGLRALFRSADRFPEGTVWLSEPGIGGDLGLPDVWIQLDTGRSRFYAPLELKRGETPLKEFRPSQRRFHRVCAQRGVTTFCLTQTHDTLASGHVVEYRLKKLELSYGKTFTLDELNYARLSDWMSRMVRIIY